jgi:uncharacterized membrane protein YidH (DUF202 family)
MKKLIIRVGATVMAFAPALALAQGFGRNGFVGLLDSANYIVGRLVYFVIALTVLVFLWGVFQYARSTDAEKRKEGQGYMVWGIVALFVMVSVWGLVNILRKTFDLDNNIPPVPVIPSTQSR